MNNTPSDEEMNSVLCHHWPAFPMQAVLVQMWLRDAMRAALAKWGKPPPVMAGEPVAWRVHPFDCGIGSQGVYAITSLPQQRDAWLRKGWKVEPLYNTLQPVVREPLGNKELQAISLEYSASEDECTGFRDGWRFAEKHYGITKERL